MLQCLGLDFQSGSLVFYSKFEFIPPPEFEYQEALVFLDIFDLLYIADLYRASVVAAGIPRVGLSKRPWPRGPHGIHKGFTRSPTCIVLSDLRAPTPIIRPRAYRKLT